MPVNFKLNAIPRERAPTVMRFQQPGMDFFYGFTYFPTSESCDSRGSESFFLRGGGVVGWLFTA